MKLGQKVQFKKSVRSKYKISSILDKGERFDQKIIYDIPFDKEMEGIVVGQRNIQEGLRWYEEGYRFKATKFHKVYIVYFSLYRKPIFVRPEDCIIVK